ncbi:MAG: AsmA family protein, partial [Deltaproteobacteria bacterium]
MTVSTNEAAPKQTPRRGMRWGRVAGGVLLLVLLVAASLLFAPPSFFFTALIKKAVHDQTGRELTVTGSRYHIREVVTVELSGVEVGRPGAPKGSAPFSARRVTARLPLRSLVDGKAQVLSLDLDAPVFNLVRQASGTANWQAAPAPPIAAAPPTVDQPSAEKLALPPTTIHNGTLIYRDEGAGSELRFDAIEATLAAEPRYGGAAAKGQLAYNNEPLTFDLAVADAAAAAAGRTTPMALTVDSRIIKARLAGEGAIGETPMLAGELDVTSPSARDLAAWLGFGDGVPSTAGALTLKARADTASSAKASGTIMLRDTAVAYDLAISNLRDTIDGIPSALTGKLSSRGVDADLDGSIQLQPQSRYRGSLATRTQSIGTLASQLGITNPALAALGPGSLTATVDARPDVVSLSETSFDADGRTGSFTGDIALKGQRTRISGAMQISRVDLDALLGRTQPAASLAPATDNADNGFATTFDALAAELDAIENPPPAFALPEAPTAAAAAAASWSTAPIDLKALRAVDLDLDLSVGSVKFGQVPLGKARVRTKLENGDLTADVDDIRVGAGSGSGQVALKARGAAHDAAIGMKLVGVDAEPITAELSGKPLLKGTSTVELATRATGRSLAELVSSLDGSAKIEMNKGHLTGWDIGAMVAELWNYKGWGYTPSRRTPVDRLTANYTIKAGTVRSSPDLTMKGPTAGLRSVGDVVV